MGAGSPDMNQTPSPLEEMGTNITYPLLKFVPETKKPREWEESTWAERQRKKAYSGSRISLVKPKQGSNTGANVPGAGGSSGGNT